MSRAWIVSRSENDLIFTTSTSNHNCVDARVVLFTLRVGGENDRVASPSTCPYVSHARVCIIVCVIVHVLMLRELHTLLDSGSTTPFILLCFLRFFCFSLFSTIYFFIYLFIIIIIITIIIHIHIILFYFILFYYYPFLLITYNYLTIYFS